MVLSTESDKKCSYFPTIVRFFSDVKLISLLLCRHALVHNQKRKHCSSLRVEPVTSVTQTRNWECLHSKYKLCLLKYVDCRDDLFWVSLPLGLEMLVFVEKHQHLPWKLYTSSNLLATEVFTRKFLMQHHLCSWFQWLPETTSHRLVSSFWQSLKSAAVSETKSTSYI